MDTHTGSATTLRDQPDGMHVGSPDGRLHLRIAPVYDERCPPCEELTLWRRPASDAQPVQLAAWTSHGLGSAVRFTGEDSLVLEHQVDSRGGVYQILIDTGARTFGFHPNERPQPLDELAGWLSPPSTAWSALPEPPPLSALRRSALVITELFSLLGGGVLAAGGAWMALAADTLKDRSIGLFGLLFFGTCAALALRDLLRLRAAAAATAPPPQSR